MQVVLSADQFLVDAWLEYCDHFMKQEAMEFDHFVAEPMTFGAWLTRLSIEVLWEHATPIGWYYWHTQ